MPSCCGEYGHEPGDHHPRPDQVTAGEPEHRPTKSSRRVPRRAGLRHSVDTVLSNPEMSLKRRHVSRG